jgi:hypothetical protein
MKICPEGAKLFHAGGQTGHTDMKKLTVAFRNFANLPKNPASCPQSFVYVIFVDSLYPTATDCFRNRDTRVFTAR